MVLLQRAVDRRRGRQQVAAVRVKLLRNTVAEDVLQDIQVTTQPEGL